MKFPEAMPGACKSKLGTVVWCEALTPVKHVAGSIRELEAEKRVRALRLPRLSRLSPLLGHIVRLLLLVGPP